MGKMKIPLHHVLTVEHEVEIEDTCPECGHKFADYEKLKHDEGEHELTCDMLQCNQVLATLKNGGTCENYHQQGHYDVEYCLNWYCPKCKCQVASSAEMDFTVDGPLKAPAALLSFIKNHDHRKAQEDANSG
jgi:rubredoxin